MGIPRSKTPCKDCPDRYLACSDHCKKDEYIAWREKLSLMKENEKKYMNSIRIFKDSVARTKCHIHEVKHSVCGYSENPKRRKRIT